MYKRWYNKSIIHAQEKSTTVYVRLPRSCHNFAPLSNSLANEFPYASFYIHNIFRKTETFKKRKKHVNSNSKRKISKIKRYGFRVYMDLLHILYNFLLLKLYLLINTTDKLLKIAEYPTGLLLSVIQKSKPNQYFKKQTCRSLRPKPSPEIRVSIYKLSCLLLITHPITV